MRQAGSQVRVQGRVCQRPEGVHYQGPDGDVCAVNSFAEPWNTSVHCSTG